MSVSLEIKGEGGTPEERVLLLRETARLERWRIFGHAAVGVSFFGFLAVASLAVCG